MRRGYYYNFGKPEPVSSKPEPKDSQISSPSDIIEKDFRGGIIDQHKKIEMYLFTLFDKAMLPREYTSPAPIKSGTTMLEEVHRYIKRKDANGELVNKVRAYISAAVPSLEKEYLSQSKFFKIRYTTTGTNSVPGDDTNRNGIPDYVEAVAAAFENAKAVTCGQRGFKTPILDSGKPSMDINLYDLNGKYGITFPQKSYTKDNGLRLTSSSISIDNNYSSQKGFKEASLDCMKVTAAHEFFHAVQNSYNADSDSWWKEASATWNEDEVYDGVNDYLQYLGKYMSSPGMPLDQTSYSGVIFVKFISEYWGGYETVKSIWDTQAKRYRNSVNAIDTAIKSKYRIEDLGSIYNRFTACNYNPSQYYKEGYLWNTTVALQDTIEKYPSEGIKGTLSHLSSNYTLFKAGNSAKTLKVQVQGTSGTQWGFKVVKRRSSDKKCEAVSIPFDSRTNTSEFICEGFGSTYNEVCLVCSNLDKTSDGGVYTVKASVE
ncbi:MAG: hypothetical protein Q8920_01745 [Bacillota bacterium]|nr:hypothetical protein [Bacillota bacterium]